MNIDRKPDCKNKSVITRTFKEAAAMHTLGKTLSTFMRGLTLTLCAGLLAGSPVIVNADGNHGYPPEQVPLDFLTGGGFIVRDTATKANFGVAGGVKHGAWWGHLNYIDHLNGLHVKHTSITAYIRIGEDGTDPQNGQPTGTRDICGTATTNLYGDVDFHVRATDNGEPGRDDIFILRLGQNGAVVYTTEADSDHTLGGSGSGGGNIQLHKGNRSNTAPSTPPVCNI